MKRVRKYIGKTLCTVGISFAIFVTYVIVMYLIGYNMRYVRRFDNIGVLSNSGKYRLVEMEDPSGKYLLYSVIQLESDLPDGEDISYALPRTVYVTTDYWYHSRYASGFGWIEGTDDFCVYSSDSGPHRYLFDGETWFPEY